VVPCATGTRRSTAARGTLLTIALRTNHAVPKNVPAYHLGSKSAHGTEVAANFYSLVESAKASGIDPIPYLTEARPARGITKPRPATYRFQRSAGLQPK
jgi:hypothetical protein